jgi:hypothetical protein
MELPRPAALPVQRGDTVAFAQYEEGPLKKVVVSYVIRTLVVYRDTYGGYSQRRIRNVETVWRDGEVVASNPYAEVR